jgi:choline-sulfatase
MPGTRQFKIMVRDNEWKYIYMANGGRGQLFHVTQDPQEQQQTIQDRPEVAGRLHAAAIEAARRTNVNRALDKDGTLLRFPFDKRPLRRIYQFDGSRGVTGFPKRPQDVVYLKRA